MKESLCSKLLTLRLSGDPIKDQGVGPVFLVGLARISDKLLDRDRRAMSDLADFPLEDFLGQDALLVVAMVPPQPRLGMVARTPHVGLPAGGDNEDAPHIA